MVDLTCRHEVPQVILAQLGGNKFLAMTGAKNLVGDKSSLRMKLPKNKSKANYLTVSLDESRDLYNMRFFRFTAGGINLKTGEWKQDKWTDVAVYEGVYADMLQDLFTEVTGMYTHL